MATGQAPVPTAIELRRVSRVLAVTFDSDESFELPSKNENNNSSNKNNKKDDDNGTTNIFVAGKKNNRNRNLRGTRQ